MNPYLESDRRNALQFANSYTRMSALLALSSAPDFWPLMRDGWSCCDNIGRYAPRLTRILERERKNRGFPINAAMDDVAMLLYASLPAMVTIWRGCYPKNRRGLSWTLDRTIAARFPLLLRYRQFDAEPLLLEATIRRNDIAFVVVDRDEQEVVALPSAISIVSETSIPTGQTEAAS